MLGQKTAWIGGCDLGRLRAVPTLTCSKLSLGTPTLSRIVPSAGPYLYLTLRVRLLLLMAPVGAKPRRVNESLEFLRMRTDERSLIVF